MHHRPYTRGVIKEERLTQGSQQRGGMSTVLLGTPDTLFTIGMGLAVLKSAAARDMASSRMSLHSTWDGEETKRMRRRKGMERRKGLHRKAGSLTLTHIYTHSQI